MVVVVVVGCRRRGFVVDVEVVVAAVFVVAVLAVDALDVVVVLSVDGSSATTMAPVLSPTTVLAV